MSVYVDNMFASYGRMKMCHLIADSDAELEELVNLIGVNLKWWQFKGTYKSHFDICMSKRNKAIELGAIEITVRELGKKIREKRLTSS